MIFSGVALYVLFMAEGIAYRVLLMIVSIISFIVSLILAGLIQKKFIEKTYSNIDNYKMTKLESVENCIKEKFKVEQKEDYILIETLNSNEIEQIEENTNIPFLNTIRQLSISVLITGLLTYSFSQLSEGKKEQAQILLGVYIMIIGTLIIISSIVYNTREFTRKYKLKQIRLLISELKIKLSISKRAN